MKNVTFLGVEGSGKTVLTFALVNVFKAHESEGWYLRPDSREAFRFLEQTPEMVAGDTLPHQTTSIKRLPLSVQLNGQTLRQLDVLDYPGEIYRLAFLEAKDDLEPATFKERVEANKEDIESLFGHLRESDHVFVLFNLADAESLAQNAANLDAVWVTNACLSYLQRLEHKPTVTLLLTQIDRYVDLNHPLISPVDLVKQRLPLIHRNFPSLDILPISAIGSADSSFGVDGLLLRCLFECDVVAPKLEGLRKAYQKISSCLGEIRFTDPCFLPVDMILNAVKSCRTFSSELPWFVSREHLRRSGGIFVDADELQDIWAIAETLLPIEKAPDLKQRLACLSASQKSLSDLVLSCKASCIRRHSLLEKICVAIPKCREMIAFAEKVQTWAIIAFAVIMVVEVVVILVRAM